LSPTTSASPLGQSPLGELDMALLGLLPFLVHDHRREEDLAEPPFLREEETVDHTLAVNFNLPDVASRVIDIRVPSTCGADLFHNGCDCRRVFIGQLVEDFPNRLAAACAPIEAPLSQVAPRLGEVQRFSDR